MGADIPTQASASCKYKANLTETSVPGDASVYFLSFSVTTKLSGLITGDRLQTSLPELVPE